MTIQKKKEIKSGFIFLILALFAFGGLGLEMLLAFLIEPLIYSVGLNDFFTSFSFNSSVICISIKDFLNP